MGGMNSGRRPKPTALKLVEGNRGHRALGVGEIRPREVLPPCPDWLAPSAKAEWERVVPELARIPGLLTVVDMSVLAGYCQSYANWATLESFLAANGRTYRGYFVDPSGSEHEQWKAHPEAAMATKERQAMRQFAIELGFSPSARGRISVPPIPANDEGEEGLDAIR